MRNESNGNCRPDSTFRLRGFGAALLALAWAGNAQALITVGPDNDPNCDFHVIQSAVYHAAQEAGPAVVAITSGTWSAQQIDVPDNEQVQIEGGFASCSAGISTGRSTLSGSGANPAGPVIRHLGSGKLVLRHLELRDGNATGDLGGGVSSVTSGELVLSDVSIISNRATLGAGLFVAGGGSEPKQVSLIGVGIVDNIATGSGGGLYALNASVYIGQSDRANYFIGNQALGQLADSGDGGAIYASNSRIIARTHSLGDSGFIEANLAQRNGGGIYADASDSTYVYLINDIASAPLRLQYNAATSGGAAYAHALGDGAQVAISLRNAIVEHNEATQGGAAFQAFADSTGTSAHATITIDDGYAALGWPGCPPGQECGSVSFNIGHGSADIINLGGGIGTGRTHFEMYHGSMRNNVAGGALVFGGNADVILDTSVLASNAVANNLVVDLDGAVDIRNSTIALNTMLDQQYVVFGAVANSITLINNIIFQPDNEVFFAFDNVPVVIQDLLTGNLGGLPDPGANNIQLTADPRFVNAGAGDLHLQSDSPAIDRSNPATATGIPASTDRDGATRPHEVHSAGSPYDFGAYEYGASVDTIFRGRFEADLPEV
jgi:hypothetical protein